MKAQCGICEHNGDWDSAPSFICFNCADAIRRLVWIRTREQQASEGRRPVVANNTASQWTASYPTGK
jgi:hypothetical protein